MEVSNEEKKAVECGYSLFSASLSKSHWLFFTSVTTTLPRKRPASAESCEHRWKRRNESEQRLPPRLEGVRLEQVAHCINYGIRCSQPRHRDFIMGEVRYNSLMKTFPQEAEELFVATERNAKLRYEGYKKLSEM